MERLGTKGTPIIFIDYAHTPDALKKALETLKDKTDGRLICVFGCGGNRDAGKRKEMAKVASALADMNFITSDNPRNENPKNIIDEIIQPNPRYIKKGDNNIQQIIRSKLNIELNDPYLEDKIMDKIILSE